MSVFVCLFVWPLRYQETREVGEVRYFTGGWLRLRMVNKNELQLIWGSKDPENCGIRVLDRWIKLLFEKSRTCSSAVIARAFACQKWCFERCEGLGRHYMGKLFLWGFCGGLGLFRGGVQLGGNRFALAVKPIMALQIVYIDIYS